MSQKTSIRSNGFFENKNTSSRTGTITKIDIRILIQTEIKSVLN